MSSRRAITSSIEAAGTNGAGNSGMRQLAPVVARTPTESRYRDGDLVQSDLSPMSRRTHRAHLCTPCDSGWGLRGPQEENSAAFVAPTWWAERRTTRPLDEGDDPDDPDEPVHHDPRRGRRGSP